MNRAVWLLLAVACKDAQAPPEESKLTVSGQVVDAVAAVANAPVMVVGLPSVTTDASGHFTVDGVTPPYDVAVVAASVGTALVYQGLTRPDPTLVFPFIVSSAYNGAALSGTVSGGAGFPLPANHWAAVGYFAPEGGGSVSADASTGAYAFWPSFSWYGAASITGAIHALQWQYDASWLPTAYTGYGSVSGVSLSAGGTVTAPTLTLGPVATTGTVSGTVTLPAGYTLSEKTMGVVFGSVRSVPVGVPIAADLGSQGAFAFLAPVVSGGTIEVAAAATKPGGGTVGPSRTAASQSGLVANQSGVQITLLEAPEPSLPLERASDVTLNTQFSWAPMPGAVYRVSIIREDQAAEAEPRHFWIVTGGTSAKLPDLSALGLGLPRSASYHWTVDGWSPLASVNAAAVPGTFRNAPGQCHATGGRHHFTTAP